MLNKKNPFTITNNSTYIVIVSRFYIAQYIYIYISGLDSSNYLLVQQTSRSESSLVCATIDLSHEMNFKTYFSVNKFISANLNSFCNTNTCTSMMML